MYYTVCKSAIRNPQSAISSGQAMIELIVGLVAILALLAGLLQVASLTKTHTDTMVEARREAGELAMLDLELMMDPDYIRDWREGPDTKRYTRDDISTSADSVIFDDTIVEKASADSDGWEILREVPDNRLSRLHDNLDPVSCFGLVRGYDKKSVDLISAVQSLLYRADTIDVECEVWMTWTKGIY